MRWCKGSIDHGELGVRTEQLGINMEIIEINDNLLAALHLQAAESERKRMNYDLRTTPEDGSQRMLNALEVGTRVPIHRHLETSETTVCLQGCLDVVFYDMRPNEDCGGPFMGDYGTVIVDGMETNVFERYRVRLSRREGRYGVQIPLGVWHSVEVHEPSTIFEAKDGDYAK